VLEGNACDRFSVLGFTQTHAQTDRRNRI